MSALCCFSSLMESERSMVGCNLPEKVNVLMQTQPIFCASVVTKGSDATVMQ